jgi:hypothetical protein
MAITLHHWLQRNSLREILGRTPLRIRWRKKAQYPEAHIETEKTELFSFVRCISGAKSTAKSHMTPRIYRLV